MAGDAVKVAPHFYKVILENDRVRVLDSRTKPGAKSEMHSHPALVVYSTTTGKSKFTDPSGETMEIAVQPGQAMYMDSVTYATENVGTAEAHVLLIELK